MTHLTVACIQLNSGSDIDANLTQAATYIGEAANAGASFICLPECAILMEENGQLLYERSHAQDNHPALTFFSKLAKEHNITLNIGSIAIQEPHTTKLVNRSFMINNHGDIIATYDKIHLFDSTLSPNEHYTESNRYNAGEHAVLVTQPWGKVGMTICYDLRFPHLFRTLAQAGAHIIIAPAAFAHTTGEAHWHTLLKARAIENGCYILASAQTGMHPANRRTYGHSLIINPWGEILEDAGKETGYIICDLDLDLVDATRKSLPCLTHDRDFSLIEY